MALADYQISEIKMEKEFGPEYASVADTGFIAKYQTSCYCNAVQIEVCADR